MGIENLTGHVNKKPRTRNKKPQNGQIVEWSNGCRFQPPGTGEMFIATGQTFPPAPFQPEGGADRRSKRNFLVIGYWLLGIENLFESINKKHRTRN